jgi:hypothetical protein
VHTRLPSAGNAWQADHIKPVHLGGGLCDITNFRTLCTVCHAKVTKQQAADRAGKTARHHNGAVGCKHRLGTREGPSGEMLKRDSPLEATGQRRKRRLLRLRAAKAISAPDSKHNVGVTSPSKD